MPGADHWGISDHIRGISLTVREGSFGFWLKSKSPP
jgi:hypothetical protein